MVLALGLILTGAWTADGDELRIPKIPGLEITAGSVVPIPGVESAILHQFEDGRLVLKGNGQGIWSTDGGRTWKPGPRGPEDKTAIDLGGGEFLSIARNSTRRPDGSFSLVQRRSLDGWKTVTTETAALDTPMAGTAGGDEGDQHDGLLMHHGAIVLRNGDLMATMFGNYRGDREPAAGYPEALGLRKYRTVVVFSKDRGKSWGDPVTVAYDRQLVRGTDPDSGVQTTATAPAVTQEGFCEPDLVHAPNGDILCVMRSGGRIGIRKAPIFPTPLYLARSSDEGRSWTPPVPIADRGVCPQLLTMKNGAIVCAYARPGSWLIFSTDGRGETWAGAFQFASSDAYCDLAEVAPDTLLVVAAGGPGKSGFHGRFFTVRRTDR
jgi:hypothetical protein